jgi:hypothetical protein
MAIDFVQIPPDSTGKRIRHELRGYIQLSNIHESVDLNRTTLIGNTVSGVTSSATGTFVGTATVSGITYIYISNPVGTFVNGETLTLQDTGGSIQFAEVALFEILHTPSTVLSDANAPDNTQRISERGSSFVRFSEGEQLFDVFGYTQQRTLNTIDMHDWAYIDDLSRYFDLNDGGGSISHSPSESTLKLVVDSNSGSRSSRTSRNYYPYIAGEGTFTIMSVGMSDNGKEGVVRRWGFFDNDDGVFFELDGTLLSVNIRSSVAGGSVIRKITSNEFNGDKILSPFDFSKFNLFWIDFQWLGVGKVRFGTITTSGERITLHNFENANQNIRPYMKSGTLPLRWEILNTQSTASSSELKLVCIQVGNQTGNVNFDKVPNSYKPSTPKTVGDEFVPLFTMRPKENFGSGRNKVVSILHSLEFISTAHPIIVELRIMSTLTDATFTAYQNPLSSIEIDVDATEATGGIVRSTFFHDKGASIRRFVPSINNAALLNPEGPQLTYTFVAKSAVPGQTTQVWSVGDWKEYS